MRLRRNLFCTAAGGVLLAVALAAAPAHAQPAPEETTQTTDAEGQPSTEVGEVVVTGSRIPQPNLSSVSPVTVIGSQEVQLSGITRTEDLINELPQAFAAQGSNISNGSVGIATVDLRALGPERTLVLVDGRRLMPGTVQDSSAADLNFIPSALIDRVEVVTGGASAVYGADAVAGVVNFIMQRNFEGVRLDAQYSFYQHENDNETIQSIIRRRAASSINPGQFRVPEENVTDGYGRDLTFVMGVNSADGRGNITAYAGWRNIDSVVQGNRDYSACTLQANNASQGLFDCAGSDTTSPARFITAAGTGAGGGGADLVLDPTAPGGRGFRAHSGARDAYNFAPLSYYQRPDERYTLGAFAHYELAPEADVYAQLMFMDDRTTSQVAPSGLFLDPFQFNCDSPLISRTPNPGYTVGGVAQSQYSLLCGPTVDQDPVRAGVQTDVDPDTPGQQGVTGIGRRNVEGGGRTEDFRHTSYRIVLGVRGDVGENWRYDLYGQYGTVIYSSYFSNDFSRSRATRALDVVSDPATGQAVCRSVLNGTDPACVPYDIFGTSGPSAASVAYLSTPGLQDGNIEETIVSGNVSGDLGDYGIRSPFANDGAGVAMGFEYRREALQFLPDAGYQIDDLTGQGGASLPLQGDFDLYELFGELRLPLVQDAPFIRELSVELGYRFSDYSLGFNTNTYKVAGEWRPIDDLRFRASYNRAVRAPNIIELFTAQNVELNGSTDPCAGVVDSDPNTISPTFSLAQCQRTGVVIRMADLLDLSGIEIVRGPQGTLQGRNATAGAILLRTANPTRDFFGRVFVSAAYPQEYRAQAVVSGPVTDTIAIRAAIGFVDEEGWATNTFNGRSIGGGDSRQGRVVVSWRPDDRLDMRFTADYSRVHNEPAIFRYAATTFSTSPTGQLVTTPTPQIPLPDAVRRRIFNDNEISLNPGSFTTVVTGGGSARISYRMDFADLISVVGVRGTEVRALNDSDGIDTARQGFNEIVDNARQVSGEVRLQSNGDGPISWIVGYYAYGENQSYDDNIYNLRFTVPTDTVTLYTGNIDTRSWAVFADATWRPTDQLSIIGGVRYTQDEKRIDGFIRPTNFTTGVRTSTLYAGRTSYENTSYRLKVQYSPTEDIMLFLGYGTGFRAGGYNPFALQPPYAPERISSWEGGVKADLFERRLSLSLTGYHNIYENLQLRAGVPTGGAIITNAAEAEINGVEFEATARPTDTLRLSGNIAWTDAAFTSFPRARNIFDVEVNASGNTLPRTPRWQYFVSATQDPLGDGSVITAEANYRWRGEIFFFFTDQNLPTWRDDAGGELGARLSWRDPSQNWQVALFGTNLTNERLINTAAVTFSYPQVGLNKPRVFGVSLERRF